MNWEAVGAIGEILGAAAVVATLLYLARQIRQQNQIAKHNTWESLFDGFNQSNQQLVGSASLAELFERGLADPGSLTADEARQHRYMLRVYQNHMLKAFNAYRRGFLDAEDWRDQAFDFAVNLDNPGGRDYVRSVLSSPAGSLPTWRDMFREIESIYETTRSE